MSFDQDLNLLIQSMTLFGQQLNNKKMAIKNGVIAAYAEQVVSVATTQAGGVLEIDLAQANIFELVLGHNNNTLFFKNWPTPPSGQKYNYNVTLKIVHQVAGSVLSWANQVIKWQDDVVPTQSSVAGKIDMIVLESDALGVNWRGYVAGTGR